MTREQLDDGSWLRHRPPRCTYILTLVLCLVATVLPGLWGPALAASDGETYFTATADLDGDQGYEVVSVTRAADASTSTIEARRAVDGSILWSRLVEGSAGHLVIHDASGFEYASSLQGVAVLDVTGNGLPDVVFVQLFKEEGLMSPARQAHVRVTALDGANGESVWQFELDGVALGLSSDFATAPITFMNLDPMLDVDGDEQSDLLFTLGVGARHEWLCIYYPNCVKGGIRKDAALILSGTTGAVITPVIPFTARIRPVGDLTGNGRPSLLEMGEHLIARTPEGTVLWIAPRIRAAEVKEVELDGDPELELLVCSYPAPVDDPDRCGGGSGGAVAIDGKSGRILWRGQQRLPSYWDLWVAGDLNDDGIDDLLGGGCTNWCSWEEIRAISGSSLGILWGFEEENQRIRACCEDLNGDERSDVVILESRREQESPYTVWRRYVARSGSDGVIIWQREWTTENLPAHYLARGDLNLNRTRDLVSVGPSVSGWFPLTVYEGSTGATLWRVDVPQPAKSWFGDVREALRSDGLPPMLILDLQPLPRLPETDRCRIHALDETGIVWSQPECAPAWSQPETLYLTDLPAPRGRPPVPCSPAYSLTSHSPISTHSKKAYLGCAFGGVTFHTLFSFTMRDAIQLSKEIRFHGWLSCDAATASPLGAIRDKWSLDLQLSINGQAVNGSRVRVTTDGFICDPATIMEVNAMIPTGGATVPAGGSLALEVLPWWINPGGADIPNIHLLTNSTVHPSRLELGSTPGGSDGQSPTPTSTAS